MIGNFVTILGELRKGIEFVIRLTVDRYDMLD